MQKLKSFDQFATEAKISHTRKLEEEKVVKRTNEAEAFKALLSEFKVSSIKELTEEQRSEFFNRLRGAELNESMTLIEEGTRGQFGKIYKNGEIRSVYTHYDSYPENMLPLIKKGYKKGDNVDTILSKGDNSGLEANPDKMNFYGDPNSMNPMKGHISKISNYLRDAANKGGAEFVYLWDEGKKEWFMADIYGRGYDDIYPAFEALSVSVNEAIQVEYKRDAKKVVTVYNNLFAKKLTDLGAMSSDSILGCVKYLFEMAMEDANFSREGFAISKNIKGAISTFEVKMPGLGNHFIKIGATTVKRVLDKHYSDIASAAGWSGIGIVEGTALYLEQIKQEAMGQSLLNAFNTFNESVVNEATVEMDAMDPDDKDFLKFLKKHRVKIINKKMDGPGGGHPVITMQGKRKDLEAVLADEEFGWADPDLAEYIEESVVTEATGDFAGWIAIDHKGTRLEIDKSEAKDLWGAKKLAIAKLRVPKSKEGLLAIAPAVEESVEVNEVASRTAMEIGGLTGMNKDAIQKFVDDNKLDIEKVYQFVKKGKSESVNEATTKKITIKISELGKYDSYKDLFNKAWHLFVLRYIKQNNIEVKNSTEADYIVAKALKIPSPESKHYEDSARYLVDKGILILKESVNEAEVKSDEEFKEYAVTVLQKAFGEEYDESKAKQVIDGILAKAKGDYGVAVGMLTSSLG